MNKELLEDSFFDNINGYSLDLNQRKIILDNTDNVLVVAGAGSGKTLTIVGKIKYLVEKEYVNPKDILCISFTNETVNSLKEKLDMDIDIYTFHKLSLEILKDHHIFYQIAESDLLEYTINEYLESNIYFNNYLNYVLNYFKYSIEDKQNLTIEKIKREFPKIYESYKKLIMSFVNNIKSHGHSINNFKRYIRKNKYIFSRKKRIKNISFLIIMFDIYRLYLEELNSCYKIDFDMMIDLSTYVRYKLIKRIQEECNSKLLCVGDDFQSIYRFSGCNLDLFVNFKKYFKPSHILYMNKTYRNSYDLIKIAYYFIIKNKYQLKKQLISDKRLKSPIKIIYYTRSNYRFIFYRLLDKLISEGKKELLILGRCNHDINMVYDGELDNDYFVYKDIKIKYLTVHSSKGLECENVIILNLIDDILGFPNKIKDDEVLNLAFKNKERYLYAEERRLFYVALTRTKNNVYLLTKKNQESKFVLEIKRKCVIIDI